MTFILIILGLVLIYLSTRNSKTIIKEDNNSEFGKVLDERIYSEDINSIKNQIKEILGRIESLENSIVLLDNQINNPVEEERDELKVVIDNTNILSNAFDNYIEKDMNSLIFQLSDEGKDLEEICSMLELGKGEVLLRLGLRK